ncbi:AAA family ATPase [Williamsia sp. R60]
MGAAALHGMLLADGLEWRAPYDSVRSKLKIRNKQVAPELQEQANQRFRTYKTLFRGLGLLYDDGGFLHSTALGSDLLRVLNEQYQSVDDYGRQLAVASRPRIAQLVAPALARYQLDSPLSQIDYPIGTDIRPLLAIWRMMRSLDNKLHWEEMGRALTTCLKDEQVPEAISRVNEARKTPGYDPSDPVLMERLLGPRQPDAGDNQSDRLDTWFSRAAFKNLLLEPRDRPDGFRHLNIEFTPLLDEIIADPPPFNSTTDSIKYVQWLGQTHTNLDAPPDPEPITSTIVKKCRRFGHRQIIALVGQAGTGKTRAAIMAATVLVEGDLTRLTTLQFHAGFTYEEFIGGLAPSESGFKPQLGALLEINERARSDPENTFVLIIDELSRADVANVLGELFTYIEYRDRTFRVPVLNGSFSIATNLIILATMNPADRSVVNMDDAMIRRLRQIEIPSSPLALTKLLQTAGMRPPLVETVVSWFAALPSDTPFGHGVFVGVRDERDLFDLWHESLRYFLRRGNLVIYPEPDKIESGYIWKSTVFRDYAEAGPAVGSSHAVDGKEIDNS